MKDVYLRLAYPIAFIVLSELLLYYKFLSNMGIIYAGIILISYVIYNNLLDHLEESA